jgi:hypothetical protein
MLLGGMGIKAGHFRNKLRERIGVLQTVEYKRSKLRVIPCVAVRLLKLLPDHFVHLEL